MNVDASKKHSSKPKDAASPKDAVLKKRKYTVLDSLYFSFAGAPISSAMRLLLMAGWAASPTLGALATALFVDTAIALIKDFAAAGAIDYAEGFSRLLLPMLAVLGVTIFTMLYRQLGAIFKIRIINGNRAWLRPRLMEKRGRLQYNCIENAEDWDVIQRVFVPQGEAPTPEQTITQTMLVLVSLAAAVLSFASLISLIAAQVWWAAVAIVITIVPLVIVSLRSGKKIYDVSAQVAGERRRATYFSEILTNREAVAERTVFGFTDELSQDYDDRMSKAVNAEFDVHKKQMRNMNMTSLLLILASGISSALLLVAALRGDITTGSFVALTSALVTMVQTMRWSVSSNARDIANYTGYMKQLTRFIAMPETKGATDLPDRSIPEFESLEFINVRFRYPNTEKWILQGLSFRIESGRHYSFVGANGAGKTTVTKLLLGLYRDYEGKIMLNGKELHEYGLAELKGFFICVFQDLAKYQLEFDESIMLGDVNSWSDGDSVRGERLDEAVRLSGLEPLAQRVGLDAHIGKLEADGIDISGGEWQRVAMARAIFSPSQVKILDEPTAALDPIAEAGVYENFRDISKGRTTIFISHRLGSTKLADTIFVLDGGKAVESGTHEQLMRHNGLYAEMYDSQRSWYV